MVLPPFFEGPTDDEASSTSTPRPPRAGCRSSATTSPRPSALASRRRCSKRALRDPELLHRQGHQRRPRRADRPDPHRPPGDERRRPADALRAFRRRERADLGGANFAPRTRVALVRAAQDRRWDDARAIWRLLEPAMTLIWQGDYASFGLRRRRDSPATAPASRAARCGRSLPTSSAGSAPPSADLAAREAAASVSAAAGLPQPSQLPESPGVCGWTAILPPRAGTPPLAGGDHGRRHGDRRRLRRPLRRPPPRAGSIRR